MKTKMTKREAEARLDVQTILHTPLRARGQSLHVYEDKGGEWRWSLKASNGKRIATCGEGHKRPGYALRAALKLFPYFGTKSTEVERMRSALVNLVRAVYLKRNTPREPAADWTAAFDAETAALVDARAAVRGVMR